MLPGAEKYGGPKGTSKVFTLGGGRHFVKMCDEDSLGNPHAEEATSKAFDLLGVPHIPTRVIAHPDNPAQLYNISPMHSGAKGIMFANPGETQYTANPKQTADTLFAEYVANVSDRHGNNYITTNAHKNPVSIDHGISWHSGNAYWPTVNVAGRKMPDHAKMRYPEAYSENPNYSDLLNLHILMKGPWPLQVTPSVIQKALMNQGELEKLAYEGTKGLPEEERSLAVVALIHRLQSVRNTLKETGGNFFVHNLIDAAHNVRSGKV